MTVHSALQNLATPRICFSSDNASGAHPAALQALNQSNNGHALAYGADPWTAQLEQQFKTIFGQDSETYLVWNGSGANVMALTSLLQAGECVVCSDQAHIALDETGAPERALGAKLLMLPTTDGKIKPDQISALSSMLGNQHSTQPGVLSLTQATELGAVYTPDEIKALCVEAKKIGMRVHLDGARIANATAALGSTLDALRRFTIDAGIDVVCFGGTKSGLMFGEAVIYLNPEYARRAKYIRKQVNQLPSKMRFVATQFLALLENDLWLRLADHANAMTKYLYESTREIDGITFHNAPTINSLFPTIPRAIIQPLSDWCTFYEWDSSINQVRWMTTWDTTKEDIDLFVSGIRALTKES